MADGRSVSEVVVAKIEEDKAQRLRTAAPPHLIIERDSALACADYLSLPARVAPIGTLFIRSAANHWDRLISAPRLSSATNTVKLRPLSESYPSFPSARLLGWGQRLMGVDPIGGRFTGSGVRIGIIDSGCDNTHPLLRHVTRGKDFTTGG